MPLKSLAPLRTRSRLDAGARGALHRSVGSARRGKFLFVAFALAITCTAGFAHADVANPSAREPAPPRAKKQLASGALAKTTTKPASGKLSKTAAKATPGEVAKTAAKPAGPAISEAHVKVTSADVTKAGGRAATLAKSTGPAPPRKPHENAYLEIPDRAFAENTRAFRYANLSDADALAELERRGVVWAPASPPFPGVHAPIRLGGPLHGIVVHSSLPESQRATSPFEILDARLALALDDFCALLARHDIVEIVHYNMYRPPAETPADWQRQIRHPAGLAIDIGAFRKRDGSLLAVGPHWPSNIGAKTCGEGAVEHWSREARELVSIVCEAADERIFHFALTPDFDAAHADHVHLEIKPATRWFIIN